jgi:CheY-like chemotaxis protein
MKTVLIVDDEPATARLLATWLEHAGYKVATASEGKEALRYLRANEPPCVILLDLAMPGMDGWQFRHEQLQEPAIAKIPTLLVTASSADYKTAGDSAGVRIFPKPFDRERLLETIAEICG